MFRTGTKTSQILWLLHCGSVALLLGMISPSDSPLVAADSSSSPKFELDIQPILTSRGCNSGGCHGKARGQNGFALSLLGFDANMDFDAIVTGSRGRRVAPAAAQSSLLLLKATGKLPHGGGIRIDEGNEDYLRLVDWIEHGVARTSATDPILKSIEISPTPHPLAAGQCESIHVTATYSDGSKRDVTKTCAYQSNEPAIVAVAADGGLKAGDLPGEATIMARYMGLISTWSTAVPRPNPVPAQLYDQLTHANFIDDHVYHKLAALNIEPSSPCTDSQYLRRVYLDAIGRLPTPVEAKDFIGDQASDKRARLVDAILDRTEYADFWVNKWADLLRPNPYRVGMKATLSLDGWLREAFRKNLPYDQFVTGLVTAQGSTWRNGAVTIFRDRREPEEIVTMVSQLFLGVRLECAKCHQHPFEVYSQRDFYSLAAYFCRVGYKGAGLSPPISGGEEMVLVKPSGEVRHPLTKEPLSPKPLMGEAIALSQDQDPRIAFAQWLTAADNPYFAKAAVNRIWADLMGIGMVDPVDDLRATNPPSNPELLDALAAHFRAVNYDPKKLLKTIFASQIYALSSAPNATNVGDYRNFSRHYRKRIRAEVLADALADITEKRDAFAALPPDSRAMELWTHRIESEMLDTFGRPDANQDPPCERTPEATMTQALHLMNGPVIQSRIAADDGRANRLSHSPLTNAAIIDELYLSTLSRFPTASEAAVLSAEFEKPETDRQRMTEDLLWSLLNTPEFLYID